MLEKLLPVLALSTCGATTAYAGGMGDFQPLPMLIPFVAGEGMYTWPDIEGFNINVVNVGSFTSSQNQQGWGGRFAAGAIHPLNESFAGSAEVGWGYYGSTDINPQITLNTANVTVTPTSNAFKLKLNEYGFDVLAGLLYTQPDYDLFFKVGALIQNLRMKVETTPSQLTGSTTGSLATRFSGTYSITETLANVLPEIKLGGAYHISDDWLATLSWMHAFGSTLNMSMQDVATSPVSVGSASVQIQSPTLDTVLFGLEYRFN